MLAVAELVAEPSLRRALRAAYREFAVISTGEPPHRSVCLVPSCTAQTPITVCACGRYMLQSATGKSAPGKTALPTFSGVRPPDQQWVPAGA